MNRKLISEAISNIEDVFIEETLFRSAEDCGHPPERTTTMEKKRINSRRMLGLVLAACLVFALAVTAYAADLGGIQRIIQIWLYGEQTTAVLEIQDGHYSAMDEEGSIIMAGGGVVFEADGSQRPVTEKEILEHLDQPEMEQKEDGSIWVYYRGQKMEITDRFDDDGICYLELRDGDDVLYATINRSGGLATSPIDYVQPWEFGVTEKP